MSLEQVSVESVEFSEDQQTAFVTIEWGPWGPGAFGSREFRVAIPLGIVQAIGAAVGNRPYIDHPNPSSDRMASGD